jgi:Peptidase family M28
VEVAERIELIRRLCSFEGRRAGTDAERRAAGELAQRLRDAGRRVDVEPTYVHPQYALVQALHLVVAIAGSLVSLALPPLGFGLVLFAAVSMYLDLNTRFYLLRRVFFRRASQNVLSRGNRPEAPARVILCAHYDAAQTGRAFDPRSIERGARLQASLPFPLGPFRILFWSIALLLPPLGARMAGLEGEWISIVQLVPTLILIGGVFLLVDIALSPVVPGANDNASGVATVLSVATELDGEPPEHLDVWVLLTGAEECLQEGMRSFVRAHRDELDRDSTYFVNVNAVGAGHVRYETAAGWVVTYAMGGRLTELCEAVAEADRDGENRYGAEPWRRGVAADSLPPRLAKYRATTVGCTNELGFVPGYHTAVDTPDRIDPAALERAQGFLADLVGTLDRDVGRRAGAR